MIIQLPANDLSGKQIHPHRQITKAAACQRNISNVTYPHFIRSAGQRSYPASRLGLIGIRMAAVGGPGHKAAGLNGF